MQHLQKEVCEFHLRECYDNVVLHCYNIHEDETTCVICQENSKTDIIVPDHYHILGYYRAAVHQSNNNTNIKERLQDCSRQLQDRIECYEDTGL